MENEILMQILSELNELRQGQASLTSELQEVKQRVIIIEHNHGKKLDAALDGIGLLHNIIDSEIRPDIRQIHKALVKHDDKITILDDKLHKSSPAI